MTQFFYIFIGKISALPSFFILSCTMKLKTFPADVELCSIGLHSFSYKKSELELEWARDLQNASQVIHDSINHLTKFELKNLYIKRFDEKHDSTAGKLEKQDIPDTISLYFEFRRFLLSVIFQSYLPAILMVLLAGFSMWIDAKSVPARVTLCVTTVLTIITIIASLKTTMPKVSYLTALDIYLWVSFVFVLSTVIEYTVLNTLMNKKLNKIQESIRKNCCDDHDDGPDNSVHKNNRAKFSQQTIRTEIESAARGEADYRIPKSIEKKIRHLSQQSQKKHLGDKDYDDHFSIDSAITIKYASGKNNKDMGQIQNQKIINFDDVTTKKRLIEELAMKQVENRNFRFVTKFPSSPYEDITTKVIKSSYGFDGVG